jgi:hypothetical protein
MVDYQTISIVLTGIGIMIAFTYYALQIRNQNRTRQAQLLMQIYSNLDRPEKLKSLSEMLTWEFTDFEDFLEKYDPLEKPEKAYILNSFMITFEGIGTMLKEGFIDIHQVAILVGGGAVLYWSKFDQIKEDIRKHMNYPRWASETEYLYNELMKYKETHPYFRT